MKTNKELYLVGGGFNSDDKNAEQPEKKVLIVPFSKGTCLQLLFFGQNFATLGSRFTFILFAHIPTPSFIHPFVI